MFVKDEEDVGSARFPIPLWWMMCVTTGVVDGAFVAYPTEGRRGEAERCAELRTKGGKNGGTK